MAETPPDPDLVGRLNALHIEDAEIVAAILTRHGLTICDADECDDDPPD